MCPQVALTPVSKNKAGYTRMAADIFDSVFSQLNSGVKFSKNLMTNLGKLTENFDLRKT